jgi:DNA modification methylase
VNWSILPGDVREQLATLPDGSVQTCVTSPPYWSLRDYGHASQIGLESTPHAYVHKMMLVFREVRRVLSDDGTLWLNLGDSYAHSLRQSGDAHAGDKQNTNDGSIRVGCKPLPEGFKEKDLVGIPWRVAFALQADGWYLRSDIIWSKPNPMPESVTDRPTKAHEYIFLLSKSPRYYYDADAVREPMTNEDRVLREKGRDMSAVIGFKLDSSRNDVGAGMVNAQYGARVHLIERGGRNKRSVWHVATQPFPEAHFATYPEKLIEPCILAGSRPGDTVLDPFTGSGTTGAVAIRLGRSFVGCELNSDYIRLAERRIGAVAPLFASEAVAGASISDEPSRSGGLFSEETL